MAVFMVEPEKTKSKAYAVKKQKRELQSYSERIVIIANQIKLGKEDTQLKKQLLKISELITKNANECENLGNVLLEIAALYKMTETEIIDGTSAKASPKSNENISANNNGSDQNTASDQKDIIQQLIEKFDLGEFAVAALKLILGLIPGVNCIVDIYDLVSDIKDATKDGKLSAGETFGLAMDVISLVGDVVSFGALVKSMESVADGIKIAKTGGVADKAINIAKKADDSKKWVDSAISSTKAGNKALQTSKVITDKTDNLSKNVVKKVLKKSTEDNISKNITSNTADYVFSKSVKSKVTYNNAKDAAKKYSEEVINNIYGIPKDKIKSARDNVIENALDGKYKKKE